MAYTITLKKYSTNRLDLTYPTENKRFVIQWKLNKSDCREIIKS